MSWSMENDEFIKEHSLFRDRNYSAGAIVINEGETGLRFKFIPIHFSLQQSVYFGENHLTIDNKR